MMDLDPEARRLLDLTRESRSPTLEDKARIERLLGAALMLGGTTAHAATGGAATKAFGTTLATKWVGVALVAMASGAGYVGWRASHPSRNAAPVAVTTPAPVPPPAEEAAIANAAAAPVSAPEPVAENDADESHAAKQFAPRTHGRATSGTLPEELDLLHEAQSKWRSGNASAALSLLEQHRKRYPRSQLAPERDALTILSLCATNREAAARKLGHRFLQNASHSPLRTSVEESCGGK
jgi:hypothetical protein